MKTVIKKSIHHTKKAIKNLPDKKQYIEFITALLSVPVLLTVILLNYNNLKPKTSVGTPSPTPQTIKEYIYTTPGSAQAAQTTPVTTQCTADIPPVSIASPSEGESTSDNPVSIQISYDQKNYCSVVWSYRVNGGTWSDYDNTSISLYNLTPGAVQLDLRIKSLASNNSTSLTRHFTYTGVGPLPTPTSQPVSSSSAH